MVRPNDPLESAARNVTFAEHQQGARAALRIARIRIVVVAGGCAAEIPQAAAAVRAGLYGSDTALGSKPVQPVCFAAGGCRARAPWLFPRAERTGLAAPGSHSPAAGIPQPQWALPSDVSHQRRCRCEKHELVSRLPCSSAPGQCPNSLELVCSVPQ